MKRFDEAELLKRYSFKSNDPVMVDVGCNCGTTAQPFADRGWRVIAYEPEKRAAERFLQKYSEMKNVTLIRKAVLDVTGELVPFYTGGEMYISIHAVKPFHKAHRFDYKVETVRLDDSLQSLNVSKVTLLKIDVEGADFLALKGFDFEKYQPELIMAEFHDSISLPNYGYTYHDMVTYMRKFGYTAYVSEREPIKEYARLDIPPGENWSKWLGCFQYPLDHEPDNGDIFFMQEEVSDKFKDTLRKYLDEVDEVK